jgi:signal transduction histidine kinase
VYGARATPYEVLHAFSERVAGSYNADGVLPGMATLLGQGIGADRAQVWLTVGTELRPAAVWPVDAARSEAVSASALPELRGVSRVVPVRDRDELLGALSVTKSPSDPITPAEDKLMADLALQAGLVLRNARLLEDLRASRVRLVAAQDEERRKIERNIHDGAQQQLVALQIKQRLAEQLTDREPTKVKELLRELQAETAQALEDLRNLARGIYPPLLADQGLVAALEARSRQAPMSVTVHSDSVGRYPSEIEATVYFCVLEALQNAAKYAAASAVGIELGVREAILRFEVEDDGRGFDAEHAPRGAGLQNMADRLDAIGGAFEFRSVPGAGTTVSGRIPL